MDLATQEVAFLFDDSSCFMTIAPFVLKVLRIGIKVAHGS